MNTKDIDSGVVDLLEKLVFPFVNNNVLSYPIDYELLIREFRTLLKNKIDYHVDDVYFWLMEHRPENQLEENVIEKIRDIADYVRIDYFGTLTK